MPLLKGKIVTSAKPVISMGPADTVYVIPHTAEQFLSKEEFDKRLALYKEPVWTCQCTGVTKLSHKEAMESEKRIKKLLTDEFPAVFERSVLELVHHSTCALESLVDEAWRNLHEFFTIGEVVTLKVKAHGKIIRGTIVKIDPTVVEKPCLEDGHLATVQKEGNAESPRKAPKLLPCKYGVRLEEEDKIINSIPVSDLVRETKLPKKDLIRFFIRTHAVRSGHHLNNRWIVDDEMIKRYSLQSKQCLVFGSLPEDGCLKENIRKSKKRKAKDEVDENCKPLKKQKPELTGKHEKKSKNKDTMGIQRTLNLVGLPSIASVMKNNAGDKVTNCQSRKEEPLLLDSDTTKAVKSPRKNKSILDLKRSDSFSSSTSSSEVPLAKVREKIHNVTANHASGSAPKRLLSGNSGKKKIADDGASKSNTNNCQNVSLPNGFSDDDSSSFDVPLAKLRSESWAECKDAETTTIRASLCSSPGIKSQKKTSKGSETKGTATKRNSVILYQLASPKSSPKKTSISTSPKKRLKQMTLFDMKGGRRESQRVDNKDTPDKSPEKSRDSAAKKSNKKSPMELDKKTPNSSSKKTSPKSTQQNVAKTPKETPKKSTSDNNHVKVTTPVKMTPRKSLPPIVSRFQKINKETNTHLYRMILSRCARELSDSQIKSLPDGLRSVILPKFNELKEKKRIELMTPEEKEAHMVKKKEQLREELKKRFAESRKRFEDTELDLQPLPIPKIVSTPDGLANELFGDVAMVAEFISCFRGLLMPGDSNSSTTEKLMVALVAGKEGFSCLSRILCILLQTLLQDKLAEDYKDLQVPLSEIPLSEYTASELVRLCLRRFDVDTENACNNSVEDEEMKQSVDNEVSEALIEQLENNEFCELDVESKVQILVGLCNRIMGTYSVQDYMDQKQQEACELWKKRIAEQKERNDKKKSQKLNKAKKSYQDDKKSNEGELKSGTAKEPKSGTAKESGMTIDHFYGDKASSTKPTNSVSAEEKLDEGEDMLSAIKRRRKAAEERKQKESEELLMKQKEKCEIQQQKEDLLFETQFKVIY